MTDLPVTEETAERTAAPVPSAVRRVVVGEDAQGRSTVLVDGAPEACSVSATGAQVQELWRQPTLPARPADDGTRAGAVDPVVPVGGAVVRTYTLPAGHEVDPVHRSDCFHVITVLTGEVSVVLETGTTTLRPSDTLILPGAMHTLHNRGTEPAAMVYTAFALSRD